MPEQPIDYELKYKELTAGKGLQFLCEQFERGERTRMDELHDQLSKPFGKWTELKRDLEELNIQHDFREREVWWCSMGINLGFEQDGKNIMFERPVLVLRKYSKDFLLVASLTSTQKKNKYYFPVVLNGRNGSVSLSQQKAISVKRLSRRVQKLPEPVFDEIVKSIISLYPLPKVQ
jgi:mRNA interferase MazF